MSQLPGIINQHGEKYYHKLNYIPKKSQKQNKAIVIKLSCYIFYPSQYPVTVKGCIQRDYGRLYTENEIYIS